MKEYSKDTDITKLYWNDSAIKDMLKADDYSDIIGCVIINPGHHDNITQAAIDGYRPLH